MKTKVFIRVDGSSEIGLGHLVRCIALANMLKNDFYICFVCKEIPAKIVHEIQLNDFSLKQIIQEDDFFNLLEVSDIVVLDGYHFNTAYQKSIKNIQCKLICIDDLHDKEFFADIIINHAPGIHSSAYQAQHYTDYLLGIEYCLLRPLFLKQAKKERKIKTIENIFICFGGSDIHNLSLKVIEVVKTHHAFQKIYIVTGAANKHVASLNNLSDSDGRIVHLNAINEDEMLQLLIKSDLAIVPASGTLFEALACGCKVISGYYANNQMDLYNGFLESNSILGCNDFNIHLLKKALNAVETFQPTIIIDGDSPVRILEKFKNLSYVHSDINR